MVSGEWLKVHVFPKENGFASLSPNKNQDEFLNNNCYR
jgi:hypothetical protein